MAIRINPLLLTDGYKSGHHRQYPKGTEFVYSNFTPRSFKHSPVKGADHVVSFGQQMVMMQIHDAFKYDFFAQPKDEVCGEMKRELSLYLGTEYDVAHFEALHDLGYLPIKVKAIKEGKLVPGRVPVLTIINTHKDFGWITNYLETIISNLLWKPITSATIAREYRKIFDKAQQATDKDAAWFVDWQGHDFSMRGMDSIDAVIASGLGHLTSFFGTDSLPTIAGARYYYGETGFVAGSVDATEHSVMCAGADFQMVDGIMQTDELASIRRMLEERPSGIFSMVSDTFDLWRMCTEYLPLLKELIMARDGKLVIRPDSGDPVDILCGTYKKKYYEPIDDCGDTLEIAADNYADDINFSDYRDTETHELSFEGKNYIVVYTTGGCIEATWDHRIFETVVGSITEVVEDESHTPAEIGVVELLWDTFGGTINEQGFKVLDSHIGAIYGDSITPQRAIDIFTRLAAKGFASTNVVLGIGSYTYQYNTRDSFGF